MPPTKSDIVNAVEAQSKTLDDLSKRLTKMEKRNEKQDSKNFNIIVGVLFATVLVVVTVAVQVIISDKSDRERNDNLLEKVHEVKEDQIKLEDIQSGISNGIADLKKKNPYLK